MFKEFMTKDRFSTQMLHEKRKRLLEPFEDMEDERKEKEFMDKQRSRF